MTCEWSAVIMGMCEMPFRKHLRGQLCVVYQVLQRVAAAEFVEQTRQVAYDSWGIRRINVP